MEKSVILDRRSLRCRHRRQFEIDLLTLMIMIQDKKVCVCESVSCIYYLKREGRLTTEG